MRDVAVRRVAVVGLDLVRNIYNRLSVINNVNISQYYFVRKSRRSAPNSAGFNGTRSCAKSDDVVAAAAIERLIKIFIKNSENNEPDLLSIIICYIC